MKPIRHTLAVPLLIGAIQAVAQCPQLYDYDGALSSSPVWYSCSGTSFTLLVASPSTIGAFTIDWGDGGPLYSGGSLVPPQSVSHVYAAAVAEYTLTFTETLTGCVVTGTVIMEESTSASIQIPVGGLTQVCAPQAVDFINSSTNTSPNTVFTWDFGDGSPPFVTDHTNLGQTISHTYLPGTVSCETTVHLSAENNCNTLQGGPSQATFNPIRVWDLDSAQIAPSATLLCWPDNEVTYLNTTDRNCVSQGNIYQRFEYWNFGDYWGAGHDSIIDWTPWPPTFPHTIAYPGIGSYDVMMLDSNYCGVDTAYVTITIVPPPSVTLTVMPDTICAGETAFFAQTTIGGANYFEWDFDIGSGFQWTGAGDQAHTYGTAGNYIISYAASIQGATAGCADTATTALVVLPSPNALFTVDHDAACDSLTVTFSNTSLGGVQRLWDFGDGTSSTAITPPPHLYSTPGTYTVTLTVTNAQGCQDQSSLDIHVYPPPTVQIGAINVCEGEPAQFTDLTNYDTGNEAITWAWEFGDGDTSDVQDPLHLYGASSAYVVLLTVTTPYCSGTGTENVLVEAKPTAAFMPLPAIGCSPLDVQFNNASSGAVDYLWVFGDGSSSTANAPVHTYSNAGPGNAVDTVLLVASTPSGCADTAIATVTVAPPVVAQFTHDALPGCAPMDVHFTNQSSGATNYEWDFGDGTSSTQVAPVHQYTNTTLYLQVNTVTLIATSPAGCADTAVQNILVYPTPDFTFVAQPDSGCAPLNVAFPSIVGAVSYQWDFGDGTSGSGPSPQHIYQNTGTSVVTYPVTMIGANAFGCVDTAQGSVSVFPLPSAQFTLGALSGCHPLTALIDNSSTGATTFQWNYGDGQTSDTTALQHTHTWYNFLGPGPATYPVTLTATSAHGCSSLATKQVEVYPSVNAAFVADTAGCSPFDPGFTNLSTGASDFLWTFGDGSGSIATSPAHLYVAQGLNDVVYTAMLLATSAYGCTDTATWSVNVHPAPIAQFDPVNNMGCQPFQAQFHDQTIGSISNEWVFGDGSGTTTTPGDVGHVYAHSDTVPVVFDVLQIAMSAFGCVDTALEHVEVHPEVQAVFSAPLDGCSPLTVNPLNSSTGAGSYLWDMGDGTMLVGAGPSHTYVNTTNATQSWTITLIATSAFGCADTSQQVVHVHPTPEAVFQATPFTQQYPASTVTIANNTPAGPWSYAWDLGDGTTSSTATPGSYNYGTWGAFTITLVVSEGICSDTATQMVEITPPLPTVGFIGSAEGCVPLTVDFTNTSLLAVSYQWNFGDGGSSTADDPVYTYTQPGTYSVTLTAWSSGGGVSSVVHVDSVVVHPKATAYFVLQPDEVIVPSQPVFLYNLSGNATSYVWDFGDGTGSTELDPVHYYQDPGEFDVTLIANNAWNCPDTFALQGAVLGSDAGDIRFPNAFTPGNSGPTDGVYDPQSFDNDFFFPVYEGVERYRLQVFDRWGELVFETSDVKVGWDGYYRGAPAKQDVYAWKAQVQFSDGREQVLTGDVTLLR
ncbi:MAG: PKD domain-containing protein [Flavobacteriales bacterium]|nr:PKD domain-containing protein [Flavobacteriales bacterium]MCB9166129.1 PKD domain-containing protein [Flavobacteriales bacterium]